MRLDYRKVQRFLAVQAVVETVEIRQAPLLSATVEAPIPAVALGVALVCRVIQQRGPLAVLALPYFVIAGRLLKKVILLLPLLNGLFHKA
jgi:ABC-type tungstate transport system substrate-binding protein